MALLTEWRQKKLKLKYIKYNKNSYNYLKIDGEKIGVNITVDKGSTITVDKNIGNALLNTGSFEMVKENKRESKSNSETTLSLGN